MLFGIMDKVPDDQKIIHISHIFYGFQLVIQPFSQLICYFFIPAHDSFFTQMPQIFHCGISFRHIIFRHFLLTKYDLYITPLCDLSRILQRFPGIREQSLHLFR